MPLKRSPHKYILFLFFSYCPSICVPSLTDQFTSHWGVYSLFLLPIPVLYCYHKFRSSILFQHLMTVNSRKLGRERQGRGIARKHRENRRLPTLRTETRSPHALPPATMPLLLASLLLSNVISVPNPRPTGIPACYNSAQDTLRQVLGAPVARICTRRFPCLVFYLFIR